MCTVCGCEGEGQAIIDAGGVVTPGNHLHDHQHAHHDHEHEHEHEQGGACHHHLDYGNGPARAHAPGMAQSQLVEIERGILSKNDGFADENRRRLQALGVTAVNFVSSPGSGKTTFLVATLEARAQEGLFAVIEGDQQTSNDAERIRATGVAAIQVNTGKGCHLDAHQVGHAIDHLELRPDSYLLIENVGNLVCPAAFDLGEACKVALLSVTEGEDKPLKYPDMFAGSRLMVLTKTDLLPHLDFDVDRCIAYARQVNPAIEVLLVSSKTGEGMTDWLDWLEGLKQEQQEQASLSLLGASA